MSSFTVVHYLELEQLAGIFEAQYQQMNSALTAVADKVARLRRGGWEGDAADALFYSMDYDVLPALHRLCSALRKGGEVTRQIVQLMDEAEQEAANCLRVRAADAEQKLNVSLGVPGLIDWAEHYKTSDDRRFDPPWRGDNEDKPPAVLIGNNPIKRIDDEEQQGDPPDDDPPGLGGTIKRTVNERSSPGIETDNTTGNQLTPEDEITVIGITYDEDDGMQWLLVRTADGDQVWVSGDFVDVAEGDLANLDVYDIDGNPVPEAEVPLRLAQAELLLRHNVDIRMYDTQDGSFSDSYREPTAADTAAVQAALANARELAVYGVKFDDGDAGVWTPSEIDAVHDGIIDHANALHAFAQANGFDLKGATPGELYRKVFLENKEVELIRAESSPKGFYAMVTDTTITFYDGAFEGPFNVAGVSGRDFTTELLIGHEVTHQGDFDYGGVLTENFGDLVDGSFRFTEEATITYTDANGEPATFEIRVNPETGELPTLEEVEDAIGPDVDLANYGANAYTGMTFVVASNPSSPAELSIDVALAATLGEGFQIGGNYTLEEQVAAVARRQWGKQQMITILEEAGYERSSGN